MDKNETGYWRCDDCDRIIGSMCKRGTIYYGYKHTDGKEYCTWCYGKYNKKHKPSEQEIKLEESKKELRPLINEIKNLMKENNDELV